MNYRLRPTAWLLAILCSALATAPARADNQLWMTANARGEIADGVLLMSDVIVRMREDASHAGLVQVRALLGHQFGPVTLSAGYGWSRNSRPGQPARVDHRLTQQMDANLIEQPHWRLVSRTMLEQRLPSGTNNLGWRLRERLKLTVPIGSDGFALVSHGEVLALLNDVTSGSKAGDIETRVFGGFLVPFTKKVGLEAGYLNQQQWQGARTTNHALSLTLATKF